MSETTLQSAECIVLATLVVTYTLAAIIAALRRRRPDLSIGLPIAVGLAVRLAAIAGIAATGLSSTLRGGDETTFIGQAAQLARSGWGAGSWLPDALHHLYLVVFAVQLKLAAFTEPALRVTQVGIALVGLVLIVAAIHDLAGPRASRLGAWLLVLEPAGLFFDSALHKEPLMILASGLVVFGGAQIWRRLSLGGVAIAGLGGAIAITTRSYAGWFLVSAIVLLVLHGALRRMDRPLRAIPMIYAVAAVALLAAPALSQVTSSRSLHKLQASQDANSSGAGQASSGGANADNLALERVDFSTRGKILTNLPKRVFDVIFRPYPWQLQDTSQQLGAIGTLVALATLALLFRYAWRSRGRLFPLAAPVIYPLGFLLVAYALSAGNAGTGFRYRTHLVMLALAALVVLREHAGAAREEASETAPAATVALPWGAVQGV